MIIKIHWFLQRLFNLAIKVYHEDEYPLQCDYTNCEFKGKKSDCYMEWYNKCKLYKEK